MIHRIYMITCKFGRRYIGQTSKSLEKRFKQHAMDSGRFNMPIGRAIKKYGIDAFTITLLTECVSKREANACERGLIAQYGTMHSANGYNVATGGGGLGVGFKHTAETKALWSRQRQGVNKGVPKSEEHRAKLSAANKGKKFTPERAAQAAAQLDAVRHLALTPQALSRRGQSRKGWKPPAECIAKGAASRRGLLHTPEHSAKIGRSVHTAWAYKRALRERGNGPHRPSYLGEG